MDKKIIAIIIVILVLIGAICLIKNLSVKTVNAIKEISSKEVKEFTIKAFKYRYSPDVINVNKGDKVRIKIDNTDVPHGIRIPDYNVKDENLIEFTANKTGEFYWYCAVYCGEGHMQMKGKLIIKE